MARSPHEQRKAATPEYWGRKATPLPNVGDEQFRVWSLRDGEEHQLLGVTEVIGSGHHRGLRWAGSVEEVTWDDVSAILTGQLTLRRPSFGSATPATRDGDEVRLEYRYSEAAKWEEFWTMRVSDPRHDFASGGIVWQLANDLKTLDESTDDFVYQKTKTKKDGWLVHEVIADVCRRYELRATITRTKHRVKKGGVARDTSPWQFLLKMKKLEEAQHGRKLFYHYEKNREHPRGRLFLTPIQRSQKLLILGPTLIAAATELPRDPRFATAVTLRQAGWKDKTKQPVKKHRRTKPKQMFIDFRLKSAVKRYGYIHRILYSPDATSGHDLLREAKRWIVAMLKGQRQFTLTHAGIPGVKRGSAILLKLDQEGLRVLIFASELHWRIGGGEFTMDGTFTLDDPYVDDSQQKLIDKLTDSPRNTSGKGKKKHKVPGANGNRTGGSKGGKPPGETAGQKLKDKYGG